MWTIEKQELAPGTIRFRFQQLDQSFLTFKQAINLWATDSQHGNTFRLFTSLAIASSTFQAFRWETPAVTDHTMGRAFEFVLVDDPALDRSENGEPFQAQFQSDRRSTPTTLTFQNLGKNAVLIVPIPANTQGVNHCHLGSYLRTADQSSGLELWKAVGLAMQDRVNDNPVWLNTAGGGVAWLHVRLDDRPKYYRHVAYKAAPETL